MLELSNIPKSNHIKKSHEKILIFKVAQMQKWLAPLERAGKADQKMVWFDMIRLKILDI